MMNEIQHLNIFDDVKYFEEQDLVILKACNPLNSECDPVELTADEALDFYDALINLSSIDDDQDTYQFNDEISIAKRRGKILIKACSPFLYDSKFAEIDSNQVTSIFNEFQKIAMNIYHREN